ncbi:MAG: putative DNA-binding domain-containing protein [Bacteroidetes bacterium]|nr:putative DNA-binding domain-containing protein [Bacteroidota bacterium]
MNLLFETKEIQSGMAMYCRTGIELPIQGVTSNRFRHYRRLIFNIIQEHLESSYPIAFEYIPSKIWDEMLVEFFSYHPCQSYQVWQIAGEFYQYALEVNFKSKYNLVFLDDLLKFEWEELRLYNMEDIVYPPHSSQGNLVSTPIVINPEHTLLHLSFPIHKQAPNESIPNQDNYYILMYRERETGKIQFMEISIWYAFLIEQFSQRKVSLEKLLIEAPKIFGNINMEELKVSSIHFLNYLKEKSFVLGYSK